MKAVHASVRGDWSAVGTVAIAVMVAAALMGVGVLHVYLKSLGIVLTPAAESTFLVRISPDHTMRARGLAIRPNGVEAMHGVFTEFGYDVAALGDESVLVPRVFVKSLPDDLESVQPVKRRKKLFIQAMLPQVLLINETIRESRQRLLAIKPAIEAGTLGWRDRRWLDRLYERYRVEEDDLAELVRRVDTVPVALALAQAAIESAWGTSRFAREGNAMFGQWTWSRSGGIVPEQRDEGASHSIRAFTQIVDSVSAYVRNLNTHSAYDRFRRARAAIRRAGGRLDSMTLAATLDRYSQRGRAYVEDIYQLIRRNGLRRFRDARLAARLCRLVDADAGPVTARAASSYLPLCRTAEPRGRT